jgi:transposase
VHQILRQANLKPHRLGTFSRSTDPDFAAKVIDVVGLYLHPPEHAVVLCVDEKTQVQALDRTQPLLPMRPGQYERRTHDYKRNGTIQLYAALEVQAGQVITRIEERHRSKEFISFMNQLLKSYPSGELHIILDNVSSHDSAEVKKWHGQPRNQRVVFHFTPTYSSWLNLVEVLFNLLQAKVLRRGVFPSKQSLVAAIIAYLQKFNKEGRSFHWKKTAETIITSVNNLTEH